MDLFRTGSGEHRTPPAHICHFGGQNSGIRTAVDALAVGIEDGEHCLLIGNQQFTRSVLQQLTSRRLKVASRKKQGALIHLTGQSNGIALLGSIISHIDHHAQNGVRVVGCPAWDRKGWPELHDLLAFESLMNDIATSYRALYLCIYDEHIAPRIAKHPHPKMIIGGRVVDNPSYIPSAEFRRHLRIQVDTTRP
jgi:MEDS: MEthanogen/methylotroph, DcmR Sensory domain